MSGTYIKCIVVDDEALARKLLEAYIAKIPEFELVKKCENAIEAKKVLQNHEIDIMFLDIQMPDLTGIDFLKSLNHKPITVFTTAYPQYALEGYQLDVLDYLVKPIPFERFFQTVSKAIEYIHLKKNVKETKTDGFDEVLSLKGKDYFFVKADYKILKIHFNEIKYIEGLREYVRIHTNDKKVITLLSMVRLMDILPAKSMKYREIW